MDTLFLKVAWGAPGPTIVRYTSAAKEWANNPVIQALILKTIRQYHSNLLATVEESKDGSSGGSVDGGSEGSLNNQPPSTHDLPPLLSALPTSNFNTTGPQTATFWLSDTSGSHDGLYSPMVQSPSDLPHLLPTQIPSLTPSSLSHPSDAMDVDVFYYDGIGFETASGVFFPMTEEFKDVLAIDDATRSILSRLSGSGPVPSVIFDLNILLAAAYKQRNTYTIYFEDAGQIRKFFPVLANILKWC
jgi:hypothetical protein